MTDNSHKTARSRDTLSAPMCHLRDEGLLGGRMLDHGCGRGHDAAELGMDKFDPHWEPRPPTGPYDVVTSIYVLNVVKRRADRKALEEAILGLLGPHGRAYLAVRDDLKETGETSIGTWQGIVTPSKKRWRLIKHLKRRFKLYENNE